MCSDNVMTSLFQVRNYTNQDEKDWNAFVHSHPQGTIFHRIEWKKVIGQTFHHKSHYLIAEQNGSDSQNQIVGILPLFEIKSRIFGHSLVSVPFAERGGLLTNTHDAGKILLSTATALAAQRKVDYVELRNTKAINGLPTKDLYFSFQKGIDPDPEGNLQAIPRKQRRMVRVGIKSGLKAEFGPEHLPDFYELLATNFHRLGTPIFPYSLFQNFVREFRDQSAVMVIKEPGGKTIAGVLTFFHQDTVLPYYAGSLVEYRNLAPNDFMYWSLMEYGRENGYTLFDFGRSKMDTGSFKFKTHWGFEPKPLAYQYILNTAGEIPNISPTNPKYQKQIEMWRKLPLWATKVIGPQIAKYLG
jgi:FemAB-related protein (PEP-CTERM system-associated)